MTTGITLIICCFWSRCPLYDTCAGGHVKYINVKHGQSTKYINWKYDKSTECCFSHLLHTAFTNIWRWLQTKGTKYSFSHLQNIEGGYKRTTTLPFGDFHGSDTDPLTGGGKPDPRWTIYFHDNCQRSKAKKLFPRYLHAKCKFELWKSFEVDINWQLKLIHSKILKFVVRGWPLWPYGDVFIVNSAEFTVKTRTSPSQIFPDKFSGDSCVNLILNCS